MSVSVVLRSLPRSTTEALNYVESLRQTEGVTQCVLTYSSAESEDLDLDFISQAKSQFRDFLELVSIHGPLSPAMRMNLAVAHSSSDCVLILEAPYRLAGTSALDFSKILGDKPNSILSFTTILTNDESENAPTGVTLDPLIGGHAFAVNRDYFLALRGFDEDLQAQELIGLDFLTRHSRFSGEVIRDFPNHRVYMPRRVHSEIASSNSTSSDFTGVWENRSIFRNLINWSVPSSARVPLVSVAIATKDRLEMLLESIQSVLYQTFQDFEIVVVDDGSDNQFQVEQAIQSLGDPRIRFLKHTHSEGVAAARNTAADNSNGLLTAVHDDDDIMLPDRLENGIRELSDLVDATYGGWINFDQNTGELRSFLTRLDFGAEMVAHNGAGPGHSTWTLPTSLVKKFRYDERLTSSVDHELATRLSNAGVKWKHTERHMYLRRVHDLQITAQDSDNQKAGHTLSKLSNRFLTNSIGYESLANAGSKLRYPSVPGNDDLYHNFAGYLPDSLISRDLILSGDTVNLAIASDLPDRLTTIVAERDLVSKRGLFEQASLENVSFAELVDLRRNGFSKFKVKPRTKLETDPGDLIESSSEIQTQKRIRQAMFERVAHSAQLLKKDPNCGNVLIVHFPSSIPDLSELVLQEVPNHIRRVLAVGEFGVKMSAFIFSFADTKRLVTEFVHLSAELEEDSNVLIWGSSPSLLQDAIESQTASLLGNTTTNDSGLIGA